MNQIKTGQFIAVCRKEQGLTQAQLAEKIGVSDRAVSKWENGKALPDASNMLDVCEVLGISVNELLTGERVDQSTYKELAESRLIEIKKLEEWKNKDLDSLQMLVFWMSVIASFALICAVDLDLSNIEKIVIKIIAIVFELITLSVLLFNNNRAGYYECQNCGHQYAPPLKKLMFNPTVVFPDSKTHYMKCPHCEKRTKHIKVLSKH